MTEGRPPFGRQATVAVLAGILLLAVLGGYLFARESGPLGAIERQTLDWRFRLRGPLPANDEIVLILIDEASLDALGGWPLPRAVLARALGRLTVAGVRAAAVDMLLTESGAESDPEGDAALTRAIALSGPLALPVAFRFESGEAGEPPPGLSRTAFRLVRVPEGGRPPMRFQPSAVVAPPARYLEHASAGHVNLFPRGSDIVRSIRLAIPYGDRYYPALPLELARLAKRIDRDRMTAMIGAGIGFGDRFIETDGAMRATINYRGRGGGFARYSLLELVEDEVPPERLEDRIVLIGATATGLGDNFATPFEERLPGVALLATVTDNILKDRFLRTGPLVRIIDLGGLLAAGGLLVLLIWRRRHGSAAIAAGVLLSGWLIAAHFAFAEARLWLNASLPGLLFLCLGGLALAGLAGRERGGRRRAEARGAALGRYVSPLVERHLERGGGATEAVHAIAMFVDMRGFTRASETAAPGEVADRLRAFHARVASAVDRHGGVIDKYLGDGVLILFGTDGAGPRDAAAAIACAQELARDGGETRVGAGLHAGPVLIGELGAEERSEISAAGDTVNVASRLQDLTKDFGAAIVASDAVVALSRAAEAESVAGFESRPGQEIRGRERPLDIWVWRNA